MYNSSKKSISKIISIFLISSILICAYSTSSSAYTDYVFRPSEFSVTMQKQQAVQGGAITDFSSSIVVGSASQHGINYTTFFNSNPSFYQSGYTKEAIFVKLTDLSITHEYNLNLYSSLFWSTPYSTEYYITDGSQILTVLHYNHFDSGAGDNHDNFNFSLESLNISTNSNLYLQIVFQVGSSYTRNWTLGVSDITLRDLDDDTGFFESIINWIRNVVNSISNLGSDIGTWFTNLGNNISTWLTTVKDGIVNKLTEVKDGIVNKLTDIKNGIVDKLTEVKNNIGEFFTMLKNYLLYFQHPVTLNADGVPVDGQGNPVYTNPFEDTLQSVSDTLDDWFDSLDDFILTIQSVNVQITGYLQTFTNIFNRFNAGVPIIGVIITLALIVIVIKKIMGR